MTLEEQVRKMWATLYWRAFRGAEMFPGSGLSKEDNLESCNQYILHVCGEDTDEDFTTDIHESLYNEFGKEVEAAYSALMDTKEGEDRVFQIEKEVKEKALKWWKENTGKDGRCTL